MADFGKNGLFCGMGAKVQLAVTAAIVAASLCSAGVFYYNSTQELNKTLLARSGAIFSFLLTRVPPESMADINSPSDRNSLLYDSVHDELNRVRGVAAVRYLYTAKRNAQGTPVYVVDGLPHDAPDFRAIGTPVEQEILPLVSRCLDGQAAHSSPLMNTSWGEIVPACEPVKDRGVTVGALVIEYDVDDFASGVWRSFAVSMAVCGAMALGMAVITAWMVRRLSLPLYRRLAYTDLLCGVYNRNAFEQDVGLAPKHGLERDTLVLSCDLNMLKTVNDQRGHAAGDAYLRALAGLLVECFGSRGSVYRTGGDEFVVLLHGVSHEEMEGEMAEVYERAREIHISGVRLFFAYGMARFDPKRDKDVHDTLARADAEMYSHKRGVKQAMGIDLR